MMSRGVWREGLLGRRRGCEDVVEVDGLEVERQVEIEGLEVLEVLERLAEVDWLRWID